MLPARTSRARIAHLTVEYTHSVPDINLYCTLSRCLFDRFVKYSADKRTRERRDLHTCNNLKLVIIVSIERDTDRV